MRTIRNHSTGTWRGWLLVGALFGASLAFVPNAHAETSAPVADNVKVESVSFGASEEHGRVWVDATLAKRFANGKEARRSGDVVSVRVPELSLADGKVLLTSSGQSVVCGEARGTHVTETGACTIRAHTAPRTTLGPVKPVVRNHLVISVEPAG